MGAGVAEQGSAMAGNGAPPRLVRPVMDLREAAEYLRLSPEKLGDYARTQILPAFRFGNRWRFRKVHLDAWMDEQTSARKGPAGKKEGKR